jgi:hypothetical protein
MVVDVLSWYGARWDITWAWIITVVIGLLWCVCWLLLCCLFRHARWLFALREPCVFFRRFFIC